jgi:putative cell wall-binding protein
MHRMPSPVRSTLAALVLLALGLFAAPAAPAARAQDDVPAEVSHGSSTAYAAEGDNTVHDLTFPLPEGSYAPLYDSYDDPRSGGRVHRANDVMADKLTTVHAVVDGEIVFAPGADGEGKPSYGYMLRLAGDDGMFYSYVHLNDDVDPAACDRSGGPEVAYAPGIREGVRVERGQHIGWVGSSGNASCSAPHLHFEIGEDEDFSVRHNPMASLEAAEERGDFPGSVSPDPQVGADDGDEDDGDEDGDGATRVAGPTRIGTAVALSRATRDAARTVVVVPAGSHVEALVAAPLAALVDAPVLLTDAAALPDEVAAEVRRLGATNAYLVGPPSLLSAQVAEDLADAGAADQARITAPDRYSLSVAVAEELASYPEVELDEVVLALGEAAEASRAWPDALSATALAARRTAPILLVAGERLPDPVADWLTQRRPDLVTVVGGTAAIPQGVAADAGELADAQVRRLAGDTRYATSVAVAEAAVDAGLDSGEVWVATGRNFPDALAAGPAAAAAGSPLLLVDGEDVQGSPDSASWLAGNADRLVVVGGQAVVRDEVVRALAG